MRYVYAVAVAFAISALGPAPIFGQGSTSFLSIPPTTASYQLVSSTRVSRSQTYYTYQAVLTNTGPAISAVTATVTSLNPALVQIVAGQGTLHFSPVPANSQATSQNTFTIMVNSSFDWSVLQWSFLNPVAYPGPNQTAVINNPVTLNASGSTNPSGIGSLTYSWAFQSIPNASQAVLSNANSMIATFVPDVSGTYTVLLTVKNGVGSDSAILTVNTDNSAPVANAGPNQTVSPGSTAQLDGSKSSDVDGNPLRYSWSFVSLPPTSRTVISNFRGVSPTFVVDVSGTYIVQLIVTDGSVSSQPATVTITTANIPPLANAGPNQTVNLGALVQLNGSASTDSNGNQLTYQWSLNTSQAPGSNAALNTTRAVNPTFTADVAGTYVAQLIVNDGVTSSQPATVIISTSAVLAPTANAGPNQKVVKGLTVMLDGSASTDPQKFPLTYTWTLTMRPPNSSAVILPGNSVNPTFVADQIGTYVAQLMVNNGHLPSLPATVTITTTDVPPVANPGPNQSVIQGSTVTLDGSQSSDSDNQPLTYSWNFLHIPVNSQAVLNGATSVNPSFIADVSGLYVIQLIVTDASASSIASTVTITAGPMQVTLSPSQLNLFNSPGNLTITLNPPTGADPVSVTLSGYNPGVISTPVTVVVPANSSGANVTVTPLGVGTTEVIASVTGYQPGTASVTVTMPSISISVSHNATLNRDATAVGLTHSLPAVITLNAPAPAGGVSIALSNDPSATGQLSFSPSSVFIPEGSTSGTFNLTGITLGSATVIAAASGYNGTSVNLLVTLLGAVAISQNAVVPAGQSASLNILLSTPAPVDGVTIALTSSDPNILTVPASLVIAKGSKTVPVQVTGVAVGSVTVTATAGGYLSDTETVKVLAAITLSPAGITEAVGDAQTINILLSSPAPPAGLLVNLSSSSPNVATVPTSVLVTGTGGSVQVNGVAPGSTTITADSTNPLFTAIGASVAVTVTP